MEREQQELRQENAKMKREGEKLEAQARQATVSQEKSALEFKHRTLTAERDNVQVRTAEEKLGFLMNEKKDLEMLLAKVGGAMPGAEMRKVVSELIKIQSDLHMAEREKQRLEAALMQAEGLLRSHVSSTATIGETTQSPGRLKAAAEQGVRLRRDVEKLREDMGKCEERTEMSRKQLVGLEDELKTLEVSERRKSAVFCDNEKYLAQKQQRIDELSKENLNLRYTKEDAWHTVEEKKAATRGPGATERTKGRTYVGTGEEARDQRTNEDQRELGEDALNRSALQQRLMQAKSSLTGGVNTYRK